MEPVKARSSVPATGSAEAAAGTCMAAAWSASVASQRRSTQRRASRGPSPPPRPMAHAHALVTGSVPAAALSSTLPRPSCRPILPTTTSLHHPLHLPPTPTSHTYSYHLLPQASCFRCQTPKPMGAGQYGGWVPAQPAGYGFGRRSDQRMNQARPSFEPPGRAPGHGTRRRFGRRSLAQALALIPHFALPAPGA